MPADGAAAAKLTNHNARQARRLAMGGYEQFSFAGWNGDKVYGWLVKPVGFDPAKKYPVAFLIHGGPQGSFGNQFHYRWNPQAYAGAGYAVVMIDFHGSTGYGQAFTDAISNHWGDRPLEDLQKGWAHALRRTVPGRRPRLRAGRLLRRLHGQLDRRELEGALALPGQPRRRLRQPHDGYYATEELWFTEWENAASRWEDAGAYEQFNPVNHVAKWKKPMLVIQGAKDFRIPWSRPSPPSPRCSAGASRAAPLLPRREPLGAQAAELGAVARHGVRGWTAGNGDSAIAPKQ